MSAFMAFFMVIAIVFAAPASGELERRSYPLRCNNARLSVLDRSAAIYELYEWRKWVYGDTSKGTGLVEKCDGPGDSCTRISVTVLKDHGGSLAVSRADEVAKALEIINAQCGEKGGSLEVKGEPTVPGFPIKIDTDKMVVHMSDGWV